MNKYLDYCSTLGIDPFKTESVERYIFFMWNSGFKKQSPESFRSAFKKYCVIANRDHPFKEKSKLMIDAFSLDKPEKVPRFISLSDFMNISEVVSLSNNPIWTDLFELARVSVWQNIRVSTLLKIKYNDIFPKVGGIYLEQVKGHQDSIWSILHPIAERVIINRMHRLECEPNSLVAEGWSDRLLNLHLSKICASSSVKNHTWHDLRHTGSQFMNDLNYPNEILQALGTWKECNSMKIYIRDREGITFSEKLRLKHRLCISTLSERLRSLRPKMVWLPSP